MKIPDRYKFKYLLPNYNNNSSTHFICFNTNTNFSIKVNQPSALQYFQILQEVLTVISVREEEHKLIIRNQQTTLLIFQRELYIGPKINNLCVSVIFRPFLPITSKTFQGFHDKLLFLLLYRFCCLTIRS